MEAFIKSLKPYTKAIIAALVGVLQVAQLAIQLSPDGFTTEELSSILGAIILTIGGTTAVYQFPNKKAK